MAPRIAALELAAMAATRRPASSIALRAPICAKQRAPPPLRAKPTGRPSGGASATSRLSHRVAPDFGPKTDRQAVPGVDGGDRQRQVHQLLLVEVAAKTSVQLVGNVVVRDHRQGL